MKEYGKTSAEHFRMRSFGRDLHSIQLPESVHSSTHTASSKYSLLLYASLCRTPVFGILAQKLCDIYSSKRLVAIRQSFNGIVHFWDADWIASHTTFHRVVCREHFTLFDRMADHAV